MNIFESCLLPVLGDPQFLKFFKKKKAPPAADASFENKGLLEPTAVFGRKKVATYQSLCPLKKVPMAVHSSFFEEKRCVPTAVQVPTY